MEDVTIIIQPIAPVNITVEPIAPVNITVSQTGSPGIGRTIQEIPAGAVNGINTIFTVANTPTGIFFLLSLNGLIQGEGDFSRTNGTITFDVAPFTGDSLQVFYSY